MKLAFTKMHGTSNDYIYVNAFTTKVPNPAAVAQKVSDRRTGVGGGGLILICPSDTGHARMEIYNAAGSRGEMGGNGSRIEGKCRYDHGRAAANPPKVDPDYSVKA